MACAFNDYGKQVQGISKGFNYSRPLNDAAVCESVDIAVRLGLNAYQTVVADSLIGIQRLGAGLEPFASNAEAQIQLF